MRLRQAHCLDNYVIDTGFEFISLLGAKVPSNLAEDELVGALTSDAIISLTRIFHEIGRLLVDCIVG